MSLYNADKLGYYQVGDYKTYSKFDAICKSKDTNQKIRWHFNADEFRRYPWTTVPQKSLSDLYRERAEQLRNDYEYLVLFYSGGSDSQQILDTFINNNIHLDEIISCCSLKGSGPTGYFNEEIVRVAIPYIKQLELPYTKFRILDQTDLILNFFTDTSWIKYQNTAFTPNCVTRPRLRELDPALRSLNEQKNMGFIWGMEKPFIYTDNRGRYYLEFTDTLDSCVSAYSQQQGWHDEFFYLDPGHIDLICKQAHTVIEALRDKSVDQKYLSPVRSKYGKSPHADLWLTQPGSASILYPDWDENTFSNGKNPSMVYGARDQWFFDNHQDTASYKNWKAGIDIITELYYDPDKSKSFLNTDDIFDGVVGHPSPRYYLTR